MDERDAIEGKLDLYVSLIDSGHNIEPDRHLIARCIESFSEMSSSEKALFIRYHDWVLARPDALTRWVEDVASSAAATSSGAGSLRR